MRRSHDENGSMQMNMYSLGVMELDLSISPDVFGLRAFDNEKPVTRMLPGSSPCELRLMIPDDKLGKDGFHDVIIENLSGTPTWRSSHVSPAEVTTSPTVAESSFRNFTTPGPRYRTPAQRRPEPHRQGVSLQWTRLLWCL